MGATSELAILIALKDQASAGLKNISKEGSGLGNAMKALAVTAVAAVGAFASFKTLESVVSTTQDLGAAVNKLKRETGGTAEESSKLLFAFQHLGLSGDDASTSLGILAKKLKGVSDEETGVTTGGKTTADILKDLGVKAFTATGELASMGQIMPQIAEIFKNMPDGVEKTGLAMQLFGRSGKDMIPILNKGAEGLAALGVEAEKFGLVLSEQSLKDIKDYTAAQRDLGAGFEGIKVAVGLAVMPALTDLTTLLTNALPTIRAFVEEGLQKIGDFLTEHETDIRNFGQAVLDLANESFQRLTEVAPPLLAVLADVAAAFQDVAANLVPILANALTMVGDLLQDHPALVYAIIAAYAAFQIGSFIQDLAGIAAGLFGVAGAAGVATGSLATLEALMVTSGIGAIVIAWAAAGYYLYTNWESASRGMVIALNRIIDAFNWVADQINKLPFAENLVGHIPKLTLAATQVANETGNALYNGFLAWMDPIAAAGAAAGNAFIYGFTNPIAQALTLLASKLEGFYGAAFQTFGSTAVGDIVGGMLKPVNSMYFALENMAKAFQDANTQIVPFKTTLPDLGPDLNSGAGGAEKLDEALRPLDQDLIDLRASMIATANEGLGVLNNAIAFEENTLVALGRELVIVNQYHDDAAKHIEDLQKSITDATNTMNTWKNTALEGTKAFSDATFAFGQSQDALQLKINKINIALLEQSQATDKASVALNRSGYASPALSAMVIRLAQAIGYDLGHSLQGGKLDLDAINRVLAAAGVEMDELGLKASNVKLTENLQLGPAQKALDELINPKREATFAEIVAGYTAGATALAGYTSELVTWQGHLVEAEALQKILADLQKSHGDTLDKLKTAYSDLEGTLTKIDPAIKAIWQARGPEVIKSIEDAFAAVDRGDKAAADQAMADAQKLFDEIKSKFPETETGFLAPIEGILKTTQTSIGVDIAGMTAALVTPTTTTAAGVAALLNPALDTAQRQLNSETWLKEMRDVQVLWVRDMHDDLQIAVDYLADIRDSLAAVPSAQHGGAVLSPGLVRVHSGERIVPAGRSAPTGGEVHIHIGEHGVMVTDRRQLDALAEMLKPYVRGWFS